jgi:hypothetical protein
MLHLRRDVCFQSGQQFSPHDVLDAVDVYLGKAAPVALAEIQRHFFVHDLFPLGLTRTGLLSLLKDTVWDQLFADDLLTGNAPVPAGYEDVLPSASMTEGHRAGWSFTRIKRLLRDCHDHCAQRWG